MIVIRLCFSLWWSTYMCSSLLELTVESHELSQAEKKIILVTSQIWVAISEMDAK